MKNKSKNRSAKSQHVRQKERLRNMIDRRDKYEFDLCDGSDNEMYAIANGIHFVHVTKRISNLCHR